jgi:hypothetical protein
MTTRRQTVRRQLEQFLAALFLPGELIELRFIESWAANGRQHSRVVRPAQWLQRQDLISQYGEIIGSARRERANVYFGVCPRSREGMARDEQIKTVRCLWCDLDHVSAEEAFRRWTRAHVVPPSFVTRSGSGIHGYWLLDRDVRSFSALRMVTAMLPHFYRSFDGDHVQNLSRVMRLPGTFNCKDARNGRRPIRCILQRCQPADRYPLKTFLPWIQQARDAWQQRCRSTSFATSGTGDSGGDVIGDKADIFELVRRLDRPTPDRSRRDFAIVCDLLRSGLGKEEIWDLVSEKSKFASNGRPYFDVTHDNAERKVRFALDTESPGTT